MWCVPLETMKRLDAEGRLHFTSRGGIRRKRYLDEMKGSPLQASWNDIDAINSQARERTGWRTQKPVALLERIIKRIIQPGRHRARPLLRLRHSLHSLRKAGPRVDRDRHRAPSRTGPDRQGKDGSSKYLWPMTMATAGRTGLRSFAPRVPDARTTLPFMVLLILGRTKSCCIPVNRESAWDASTSCPSTS